MATMQCNVEFKNNTGRTLTFYRKAAQHGEYLINPPAELRDGETGNWETGSDGVMTGSEATVEYTDPDKSVYRLHWANPFVGPTWETHMITPDNGTYALTGNAGGSSGGNAKYVFRAFKK